MLMSRYDAHIIPSYLRDRKLPRWCAVQTCILKVILAIRKLVRVGYIFRFHQAWRKLAASYCFVRIYIILVVYVCMYVTYICKVFLKIYIFWVYEFQPTWIWLRRSFPTVTKALALGNFSTFHVDLVQLSSPDQFSASSTNGWVYKESIILVGAMVLGSYLQTPHITFSIILDLFTL